MELNLIKKMGFVPKDGTNDTFYKKYDKCGNYIIEVDFKNEKINFISSRIKDSKQMSQLSKSIVWSVNKD